MIPYCYIYENLISVSTTPWSFENTLLYIYVDLQFKCIDVRDP
jgi:hypothetical protein